ncbi:MAG TPA: lysylphosphatidylglycerol synthase domain-containing protein [Pyrinomonadaceae bacterium]|nr:lysylphosphatidylglycerol synthase domain-containing protein [Pyrinomonadaceae bacterium]
MPEAIKSGNKSKRFAPLGIIFAVLGLMLFAYTVRKAGVSQIVDGIQRLGIAFLLLIAISSIRLVVRALAWTKCFEPPYRLNFRDALAARVMGDALGNIIPLASMAVSEPSKAAFVRHRVPLMAGLSALAIENIFYSLSVVLFIFSGTTALLLTFPLPKALRYAAIGTMVGVGVVAVIGYLVIHKRWRFLSGVFVFLSNRTTGRSWLERATSRTKTLEERIYGFYDRNRRYFLTIFALEICFHLAGVLEIYTTLSFISETIAPTLLTAFILESVNRVINVVFKFVPLRTGVDEAGTGMLAKVLGFTTTIGVTLAIVRKARDIFWTTVGVTLMVRRGLSLRTAADQGEEAVG